MADLDPRYPPQDRTSAFVNHRQGILVCLAGPGTGKTFSMLKHIEALYGLVPPEAPDTICYLTFIRAIGSEFTKDYIDKFTEAAYDAGHPRISTLHSFACKLIKHQGHRVHYNGALHFLNVSDKADDSAKLFRRDLLMFATTAQVHTEPQLRDQLDLIKDCWQDRTDLATLPAPAAHVLPHYLEVARVYRLVDWDQTMPLFDTILGQLPDLPEWIAKYRRYLVDEYQDFNRAEQHLIGRLTGGATSSIVVGDDDQSLYKRRGGSPDGIRDMAADPALDHVSLVISRRCPTNIAGVANRFLAWARNNARQLTPLTPGGTVEAKSFKSSKAEVAFLRDFLLAKLAAVPPNASAKEGCTCLFRSSNLLNYYRNQLALAVPCWPTEPHQRELREWLETVLRLVIEPEQRLLQRLLLSTYPGVGQKHVRLMLARMLQRDESPVAALRGLVQDQKVKGKAVGHVTAFCDFHNLLERAVAGDIARAIAADLQATENLVTQAIDTLKADAGRGEDEALAAACDAILPNSIAQPRDPHRVEFITMHSAKGLTRKTVVLPGLEVPSIPGDAAGDDLEEEKRLFFVALTRATDHLLITLPRTRARGDRNNYPAPGRGKPSPFIAAAGIPLTVVR